VSTTWYRPAGICGSCASTAPEGETSTAAGVIATSRWSVVTTLLQVSVLAKRSGSTTAGIAVRLPEESTAGERLSAASLTSATLGNTSARLSPSASKGVLPLQPV